MVTPEAGESGRLFGDGLGETNLQTGQKERKMTVEELAEMSLESLLYYVLVGEGRRQSL